jgi:hypothetical protein
MTTTISVIGTVFAGKGKEGDFEWQIRSGKYENALFVFNEDEKRVGWKKAGRGNAVIRKWNHVACPDRPRAVGIFTGGSQGGYKVLNPEIQKKIDSCFDHLQKIMSKHGYTTIYYSAKPNGLLGTSIFEVAPEVLEYITKRLKDLQHQ